MFFYIVQQVMLNLLGFAFGVVVLEILLFLCLVPLNMYALQAGCVIYDETVTLNQAYIDLIITTS
jgi:hypothetical protein